MNYRIWISALAGLTLVVPVAASAQEIAYPNEASRDLAQCIALSTTGKDRILTAQWFATSIGAGESMQGVVTINPDAKKAIDKSMGELFTRIFTQDCRAQSAPLLKASDTAGIQSAGGRLGQIAMVELMNDPLVKTSLLDYLIHVDTAAITELAK